MIRPLALPVAKARAPGRLRRATPGQTARAQFPLAAHDVKNKDTRPVVAIENPAWLLDDLPVAPAAQFRGLGAAFRMRCAQRDMAENLLNEKPGRFRIVE